MQYRNTVRARAKQLVGRHLVAVCIATLLIAAAGVKIATTWLESGPSFSDVLLVVAELSLAAVLILRHNKLSTWAATGVTFGCFAFVTLHQGLTQASSCGCFGRIEVHPWIMFTVDSAVVAMRVFAAPLSSRPPLSAA